jgi:hypothetical protein
MFGQYGEKLLADLASNVERATVADQGRHMHIPVRGVTIRDSIVFSLLCTHAHTAEGEHARFKRDVIKLIEQYIEFDGLFDVGGILDE